MKYQATGPGRQPSQNIVLSLAAVSGIGWMTSQCSTALPSSKRRMSTTATPRSSGEFVTCASILHEIALRDHALDLVARLRVLGLEVLHEPDERLCAVRGHRVVLDVHRALVALGRLLRLPLVEREVDVLRSRLLVALGIGHHGLLLEMASEGSRTLAAVVRAPQFGGATSG